MNCYEALQTVEIKHFSLYGVEIGKGFVFCEKLL